MGRRDERERDIYGRNASPPQRPPPQRGGGGGGGKNGSSAPTNNDSGGSPSPSSRGRSDDDDSRRSPSRSRSYSTASDRSARSGGRAAGSDRSAKSGGSGGYSSRSQSSSPRGDGRGSRRSHTRSPSRSYSRSPSPDPVKRGRGGGSRGGSRGGGRRGGGGRRRSPRSEGAAAEAVLDDEATKDQRTIFVSQLVMRADERDISRYFRRRVGISEVRDVILLRDKRTGRHKGCAYVEVGRLEDVDRALGATGKTPDFQRFPILVKRAEAEKNALALGGGAVAVGSLSFIPPASVIPSALVNHGGQPVQLTADGMRIESQKVYVGSIDPCVTQPQLHALFSQFGTLEKILLQTDASTGMSRGFAFVTYRDPKDANLAIQTMSGQMLAGRPL
jgi:RNA-binding protein 39